MIASITERAVAKAILEHLGLPTTGAADRAGTQQGPAGSDSLARRRVKYVKYAHRERISMAKADGGGNDVTEGPLEVSIVLASRPGPLLVSAPGFGVRVWVRTD